MFSSCKNLKSINLEYFNTTNVDDMSYMFLDCKSLTSIDLSVITTYNVKSFSHMLSGCESLTSINFNIDASKASDLSFLFYGSTNLEFINMSDFRTTTDLNMKYILCNSCSLKSIDFGYNNYEVNAIAYAFHGCSNLTDIDFTNFDVRDVTDMRSLFYGCKALTSLNLRTFRTTKCLLFNDMFAECNEMNVSIYRDANAKLIESASSYINFLEMMFLKSKVETLLDE